MLKREFQTGVRKPGILLNLGQDELTKDLHVSRRLSDR